MREIAELLGWIFITTTGLGVFGILAITIARHILGRRSPQIVGADLPATDARIDLSKRYDIVYGAPYGATNEKLISVRILGYLRSDWDQTTGEYMDSRWLVVELADGRRAYLRPRSVLWLQEATPA